MRVSPTVVRTDPDIEGLEVSASEWQLDVERYEPFVEAVTGIAPADDLDAADWYRIGNRLRAMVDERKRRGEWSAAAVEEFPVVESSDAVIWLARFFTEYYRRRAAVA